MSLSPSNSFNLTGNARLERDRASYVTTAQVGGIIYIFVAGFEDDDVSVFAVADEGAPTHAIAGRLSPDRAALPAH